MCKVTVLTRISHAALSLDPAVRASPSGTYHIDEADGGLYIVGLGDYNLRGGKHLHQCLVLLQRHRRGIGHLDPDGEWTGLGVLLEHLWAAPDVCTGSPEVDLYQPASKQSGQG